jgi:hypothetical protein
VMSGLTVVTDAPMLTVPRHGLSSVQPQHSGPCHTLSLMHWMWNKEVGVEMLVPSSHFQFNSFGPCWLCLKQSSTYSCQQSLLR